MLETTFTTASGSVRVTDAMLLGSDQRELIRVVDPREGRVRMRWRFEPRTDVRLASWDAGDGELELGPGHARDVRRRRDAADPRRRRAAARAHGRDVDGLGRPGRVRRPLARARPPQRADAEAAHVLADRRDRRAPTTSLPERIGGDRNWDYRFSWLRDGIYTMRALLSARLPRRGRGVLPLAAGGDRARPPRGEAALPDRRRAPTRASDELDLPGYRGSRPVRSGNAATSQLQLDVYGHLLESASRLRSQTGFLDPGAGRALAQLADFVADSWRRQDAGIWEVRDGLSDFVQSKAMCWTALDRAAELAAAGAIPGGGARWREEAEAVRAWIESEGWNEELGSYVRLAPDARRRGGRVAALAAAVRLLARRRPALPRDRRHDQARARRGGPLLYRTAAAKESEGAFLTCSFWLVDALGRAGRTDEGHELMGRARRARERRRPLRRGDRPGDRRAPRQLPAGARPPRARQRAVSLEEPD